MRLLTDEIRQQFRKYPLYSQESRGINSTVIVKYFNPVGSGTWLITEAEEQEDGDWLLCGYCHISGWEWGYVSVNELQALKLSSGLTVERDLYIPYNATVKELAQ